MKLLPMVMLPLLLLGCGGGSGRSSGGAGVPLNYEDPQTEGWRLVKDDRSGGGRLVLALVGPKGQRVRGVALTLLVDGELGRFLPFEDGSLVASTGVLVTTTPGKPEEPRVLQLLPAAVSGNKLTVGVFQKDVLEPAKEADRPLFTFALGTQGSQGSGTVIPLMVRKATVVPEDLEGAGFRPQPIKVALGRVVVQ